MDNFSFRGKLLSDFGAVCAYGQATTIGTKIVRSEYALPGGGTVEIGAPKYEPITKQMILMPADGVNADEAWRRNLLTWLGGGRGEFIELRDPGVYRLAQFTEAATYTLKEWPLGALSMKCTMQGLCHAVRKHGASKGTSGGSADIALNFESGLPVPVELTILCESGTITRAEITAGGDTLTLPAVHLASGQTLAYYAGDSHGTPTNLSVNGVTTFAPCAGGKWARLEASPGEVIRIRLTGGEATCRVSVRGRWLG